MGSITRIFCAGLTGFQIEKPKPVPFEACSGPDRNIVGKNGAGMTKRVKFSVLTAGIDMVGQVLEKVCIIGASQKVR